MRAWLLGRLLMSENPAHTYKVQTRIIRMVVLFLDYFTAILLGALIVSCVYKLGIEKGIVLTVAALILLSTLTSVLTGNKTLRLRCKDIVHQEYNPPGETRKVMDFTPEQVITDAKVLVHKYVNSVPGVSVSTRKRLPFVWAMSSEALRDWKVETSDQDAHFFEVAGVYLPVVNTCLVAVDSPYHHVLVAAVHELLHSFTTSEPEVLYMTAYLMYLAGRGLEFSYADSLMRSNPNAMKLWEH